ncbi:calcium-binding protein [Sphingomicrobium clamense]|uniref:Uncharacterized protein n=1 Tax=Sphingomicrobium clamense TaxID=2851013 RepID=A0ABS6V4Q2_9SPHN|nr:calcium-binding protein [Sphingomicrobium sp. B8]MBW0144476.1 hypothetical protein [Sphingomicrobium sp. B8]
MVEIQSPGEEHSQPNSIGARHRLSPAREEMSYRGLLSVENDGNQSSLGDGGHSRALSISSRDLVTISDGGVLRTQATSGQTITGTTGDDVLEGTVGDDTIDGLAGNDFIYGYAGDDILRGGDGNDQIYGGYGADLIEGGEGDDWLQDTSGSGDQISGGGGIDQIKVTRTDGPYEYVSVDAGAGDDSVSYYNFVDGEALIDLGIGNDLLHLFFKAGSATISLGEGIDTIILDDQSNFSATLSVTDFSPGDGGDKFSWVYFLGRNLTNWDGSENPFGSGHLRLAQDGSSAILQIDQNGGGDNYVTFVIFQNADAASFTAYNFEGYSPDGNPVPSQTITGTESDDNWLYGGVGDDLITGLGGNDSIAGGFGHDTLRGGAGDDHVNGDYGNDIVDGGEGNDLLTGGYGNDIIQGGDGADRLSDVGGDDQLVGGGGADDIRIQRLYSTDETITIDAGLGDDFVLYHYRFTSNTTIDLGAGDDNLLVHFFDGDSSVVVTFGDGQDTIQFDTNSGLAANLIFTDFAPGESGDAIVWTDFLSYNLLNWDSSTNPFGTGHVRLVQQDNDTLVQVDQDGGGDAYITFIILLETVAADLVAYNFDGFNLNGVGKTLVGSDGPDELTGTADADTIEGQDGDDFIEGLGGDDTLDGGPGNDEIYGGEGNDRIDGGFGDDFVDGGVGDDDIRDANGGSDTLHGGDGNDTIFVFRSSTIPYSHVQIDAGEGNDTVTYVNFNESDVSIVLSGGDDYVTLRPASQTSEISFGGDRDTIELWGSGDIASNVTFSEFAPGDSGANIIWASFLSNNLTNWNGKNPFSSGHLRLVQDGVDTLLQFDRNGGSDNFTTFIVFQNTDANAFTAYNFEGFAPTVSPINGYVYVGTELSDTLVGSNLDDKIEGLGGNDSIWGQDGADQITGGAGRDILRGGLGNDRLLGDGGEDTLFGEAGDDELFGGTRADELFGGPGNDMIVGGVGNDRANGGSGNDYLDGGADNDLLIGGPDNDRLRGGEGDDQLVGGSSSDYALYDQAPGSVVVDLFFGTAAGDGNDTLEGIENVIGSAYGDVLKGDAGPNLLDGSGGEDSLYGRAGNDTLNGGSRADELFGGTGDDILNGGSGNDRINGGSGNDRIDGGGDNDLLIGGPGDDIILGGVGDDFMAGGSGNDTFVFDANSGADMIAGFTPGGEEDMLDFSALGIGYEDLSIIQQGTDTLITTPAGDSVLLFDIMATQLDQAADFAF